MSVARNLLANYLGGAWSAVLGLAMLPVYLRFLGIEAYGLVGFFVTLQAWLVLLDMGLTPALNREMARFTAGLHTPQTVRDLLRSMEAMYGAVALLVAVGIGACAAWIVTGWLQLKTLDAGTAMRALAWMGLAIGLQWMATLYRSAVLGLQDQVWLSATTALLATLRAIATAAVLALVAPTVIAYAVVQCVVALAEVGLLAHRVHRRLPAAPRAARFSLAALRQIWRFAAGLSVITLLATALTQVDKLLLARLLPLDQFGYFSLAVTVAGALSILIGPINNVAFPRFSELAGAADGVALVREYHRLAQLLSVALLPAALVLAVFAPEIMLLWTRDAELARQVAPILSLWTLGTALNGLMHVPYAAQLAHGWSRLTIGVNAVSLALMVPATLLLVPRHGAVAAAWIWVAINVGYIVVSVGLMHLRILRGEKWRWYLRDVLAPLLPAALVVVGMHALHAQQPGASRAGEVLFLAASTLFAALAAALSTASGRTLLRALVPRRPGERLRS